MKIIHSALKWWLLTSHEEEVCLRSLAERHRYRLGGMCGELGCSERYLRRVFVDNVGLTPTDWIKSERMVEARHRLREGADPLEVANRLGFASISSFGRLFKATYGIGPRTYQRQEKRRLQDVA